MSAKGTTSMLPFGPLTTSCARTWPMETSESDDTITNVIKNFDKVVLLGEYFGRLRHT